MITENARAKINLTLHVGRVIEDHSDPFYLYHPLDSLVVFADVADTLTAKPSDKMELTISGPFADQIDSTEDNLVLKTIRAVERAEHVPPLAFHLTKNLPVAAGIGGGSANAAATLRIVKHYVDLDEESHWDRIALGLGADVPVCLASQTCRMTGIGETVTPLPGMGQYHGVLVNPGVGVSTAEIFHQYDKGDPLEVPKPHILREGLMAGAHAGNNDLQPIAEKFVADITKVVDEINLAEGCELARMSGSGATCFGVFRSETAAARAAQMIAYDYPQWWVTQVVLGDQ